MFREFLLNRAAAQVPADEWRALQRLAARRLATTGQADAAAALYRMAQDWLLWRGETPKAQGVIERIAPWAGADHPGAASAIGRPLSSNSYPIRNSVGHTLAFRSITDERSPAMSAKSNSAWFPLFEFQDWIYQSFLLLPTPAEDEANPGAAVGAKKWARGTLMCGQAFASADGYTLTGTLVFPSKGELSIAARGKLGDADSPATFEATGTGTQGLVTGMVSQLVGWVTPELPVANGAARVLSVRGSIRAVRGTDAKPEVDPSGVPLGTVGAFVIARAKK